MLVPLLARDGVDHVVFIQRSHDSPTHQGQVAFPGGRHDSERDGSLLATALREAEEEIGLHASDVDLILALPDVRTLTSNFLITPFVGRIVRPCVFHAEPREVVAVFTVSVTDLRQSGTRQLVRRQVRQDLELEMPAFVVGEQVIWGATQRITEELLRRLP